MMTSNDVEVTAESAGFVPVLRQESPLTAAAAAREEGAIKAMILTAMARPRDEHKAFGKIIEACKRPLVASSAEYSFPRGGEQVSGPSVKLARMLAMYWGNVRSGIKIVEDTPTDRHVAGWAHDVETNAYTEFEHRFQKRVQRKNRKTGVAEWIDCTDERDIREMTARWGALCERNALLKLLPPDVIDHAMRRCTKTRLEAAKGALGVDRQDTVRLILARFNAHAVTKEMVERRLGHEAASIDERELADLEAILQSLDDGNSHREEYFELAPSAGNQVKAALDALQQQASAPATPPAAATPEDGPVTQELLKAIGVAIAAKRATSANLTAFRRENEIGGRVPMTCEQARRFLAMVESGEVARYDEGRDE